jgi:hypothetical protein
MRWTSIQHQSSTQIPTLINLNGQTIEIFVVAGHLRFD